MSAREKATQVITDLIGYPHYIESIEVDVLPDTIKNVCNDIIDAVLDEFCDTCEYYCGVENCENRR